MDQIHSHLRFNIQFLANRLLHATQYLMKNYPQYKSKSIHLFGASTGGAAAIEAGIKLQNEGYTVSSIISRGGRVDMAHKESLENLTIPTLMILGGNDTEVIRLNEKAYKLMKKLEEDKTKKFIIIPDATHLFPEKGALEQVAKYAKDWMLQFTPQRFTSKI